MHRIGNTTKIALFISIVVLFLLSFVFWRKDYKKITFDSPVEMKATLKASMEMMGQWLFSVQKDGGDFTYQISVPNGEIVNDNNIVRQAGALYGLSHLYKYNRDSRIKKSLEKGFSYFAGLSVPQGKDSVAIVYKGEKRSNTSALLLLALVEYLEAEPDAAVQYGDFAQKLANFLVTTQTDKGSFINELDPQLVENDYNNGETFYALTRAYKLFNNQAYLASSIKAAEYFDAYYGNQVYNSSFFSWGMAGFSHLYTIVPDDKYWQFLKNYTDKYLAARGADVELYIREGKGEPIKPSLPVYLEGVAHTAWIAKERDKKYFKKLKDYIEESLVYMMRYQVGSQYSEIHTENIWLKGGVCQDVSCSKLRIDFTQHNLSAIYFYLTLVEN